MPTRSNGVRGIAASLLMFAVIACGENRMTEDADGGKMARTHNEGDRMAVEVAKGFFEKRDEVLDDLKASGFWPTTFVSGPSPGIEVHWHDVDVHAYVMEGTTSVLDAESGHHHPVGPGDKIVIPTRVDSSRPNLTRRAQRPSFCGWT